MADLNERVNVVNVNVVNVHKSYIFDSCKFSILSTDDGINPKSFC